MAGIVHVPFYATGFRGDQLEIALSQIAPLSLNYGATNFEVFRGRDDRYKFLLVVEMPSHHAWESYWYGPDFNDMRAATSSWYQVPVLYTWHDRIAAGAVQEDVPAVVGNGA